MTVREFIEHLQTLDPDKNIWVIYDNFYTWEPEAEVIGEADECKEAKVGDYAIFAG